MARNDEKLSPEARGRTITQERYRALQNAPLRSAKTGEIIQQEPEPPWGAVMDDMENEFKNRPPAAPSPETGT